MAKYYFKLTYFTCRPSCVLRGSNHSQPSTVSISNYQRNFDIQYLEIKRQATRYLPNGIGFLFPNLTFIRVIKSELEFIGRKSFESMSNVKELSLSSNEINLILFDSFYDLINVERIELEFNKLRNLHGETFIRNQKLKYIGAEGNEIEHLPAGLFRGNDQLIEIRLSNNKISRIDANFRTLQSIKLVNLHINVCINGCYSMFGVELEELLQHIQANCFRPLTNRNFYGFSNLHWQPWQPFISQVTWR